MLAIALGLGSGLFWGLADFGGGLQSRRHPVVAVLFVSQAVGLAGLVAVVALSGEEAPALDSLWPAAAGGIGGPPGPAPLLPRPGLRADGHRPPRSPPGAGGPPDRRPGT